jgi:hypothetical protein
MASAEMLSPIVRTLSHLPKLVDIAILPYGSRVIAGLEFRAFTSLACKPPVIVHVIRKRANYLDSMRAITSVLSDLQSSLSEPEPTAKLIVSPAENSLAAKFIVSGSW